MDPEELALRRDEYYDTLVDSESLHDLLNENAGLVLARVGSYPPWPARFSEPGEYAKMSKYRLKKSHVCVYFFGTRNFGWVPKSAILPFTEDIGVLKTAKKYNTQLMQKALEEAKFILDGTDGAGVRFYDRIMERRGDPVDLPCEICNRVDDHYSNLILCDGVDCKREFHMNCLVPPLVAVPPGDWFCPDCAKDQSKQVHARRKPSSSAIGDAAEDEAADSLESATTPFGKSSRKFKQKQREGSLKRRLQSEIEPPDVVGARQLAKRSRFPRASGDSSVESSPSKSIPETPPPPPPVSGSKLPAAAFASRRKPPAIDIATSAHHAATAAADLDDDDSEVDSDERCLICGYGGDLIICEFPTCTKVYHQFCLGAYPFPKDDDVIWLCPRHTCVLSGEKEWLADGDGKGRGASPRKPVTKNLLWKCTQCPVAISADKFPPLPSTSLTSKKLKTFLCPNCGHNAPAKVQLAKALERVWSTMATNRQGMPFCGPLLAGVSDGESDDDEDGGGGVGGRRALDLFKILAKIRGLEYENSAEFVDDVDRLVANALEMIGDRSRPLIEAARTIKLICSEQFSIHQHKILAIDNKVKRSNLESRKQKEQKDSGPWSWKRKWPIQWRQECGGSELKKYPQLEPRSLIGWTTYAMNAPMYASGDVLDDRFEDDLDAGFRGGSKRDGFERHGNSGSRSKFDEYDERNGADRALGTDVPSFPGLTLSEGTDIMMALGTLSRNDRESKRLHFAGVKEGDFDDVDGRDFFLSPSSSEMQLMFEQQSLLLRQALEAQSALQRSWLLSKHNLLGLHESGGFSVGEGRLAAELRLANKNLRARLRNKDKLVDQLAADQATLKADMAALERELSESKASCV
ncbi:hypothetical protein PybrP1_008441 [[Pythium] brassicae (nom. inval.)]|nr:hypothetical protein PybrP1_008441 [[Pythium] brassicae (nom. inval.)]